VYIRDDCLLSAAMPRAWKAWIGLRMVCFVAPQAAGDLGNVVASRAGAADLAAAEGTGIG
jgi:hypothetical protein